MTDNPYLSEVHQTLPRVLSLFNTDPTSNTFGYGDRLFWSWKLTDFANGTFQGAVHGMSLLLRNNLLPTRFDSNAMLKRIDSIFIATENIARDDGSLEEAFPYEGSYCVTALIVFDQLNAIYELSNVIDASTQDRYLRTVGKMVEFLIKSDETHAVITNHLATAAAALMLWSKKTGSASAKKKALMLLERIKRNFNEEGWFNEYGGADPGYQSLGMYFLASLMEFYPEPELKKYLNKSCKFLSHFVHPDGSFGGLYGSRGTQLYYPAGFEILGKNVPFARAIANYMSKSIKNKETVTLASVDEPNLIPMFNVYCRAAVEFEKQKTTHRAIKLPCERRQKYRKFWPIAGLLIDSSHSHYTVISTHRGGVTYHFNNKKRELIDTGILVETKNNVYLSSQSLSPSNKVEICDSKVVVHSVFHKIRRPLPGPLKFLVLRLLNLTLMRFYFPREYAKRFLVKHLITGNQSSTMENIRTIQFGSNLVIQDTPLLNGTAKRLHKNTVHFSQHMASSGYWQIQDEERYTPPK